MKRFLKHLPVFTSLLCLFGLLACGGGGGGGSSDPAQPTGNNPPAPVLSTGVYIDSAVEGLNYRTATQAGMTNQEGEFTYQAGESIIFSIGDIDFPSVDAEEQLTPLDIFQTADYENVGVVNMLRLLQTLDEDGVAGNGIVIASNVHSDAAGLTLDFTAPDFDSMVATLVANSGSPLVALIGAEQAINHLRTSLDDEVAVACGSDHAKVGFSGSLSTLAHNVSGTATIIDNCTIQITAFNYDGGGPQVYFYAADNFMFGSDDAFSISGAINGQTYVDRTLVYSLPNGKTLDDFDTLSVWCSDFNANFGDLIFAAP